jgi:hypothetical protein
LIYGDESRWDGLGEKEREEVYDRYRAFAAVAAAKIVDGAELAPTAAATTVRIRDGQSVVTDGPFAETKEQLGGLFLTTLPDLDEAIRLAALVPAAEYGSLEIRPIVER